MMQSIRTAFFAASVVAIGCGGCASEQVSAPLHTGLESMSSEVVTHRSKDLSYSSAVSLTGLSRVLSIADQILYPGNGLADAYAIPIAVKFSRADIVEFPMDDNPPTVSNKGVADTADCPMSSAGSDKKEAKLVEIANLLTCARDRIVDREATALQLFVAEAAVKEAKAKVEGARTLATAVLLGSGQPDAEDATLDQAVLKLAATLGDKQRTASAALSAAQRAINTRNVFVTHWTTEESDSQGGGLGAILGGNRNQKSANSGFLILGDLRVASISFGEDYLASLIVTQLGNFRRGLGVVTTVIQSRYQVTVQDIDYKRSIAAQLHLTPDQISSLGGRVASFLANQELTINAELSELASVGNSVIVDHARHERYPFSFYPWQIYESAMNQECQRSNGYNTIYSIRATGKAVLERVFKEADLGEKQIRDIQLGLNSGKPSNLAADFLSEIEQHNALVLSGKDICKETVIGSIR